MLNGAVTVGTLDGANVEIAEEVGIDNCFIFGLRAEEIINLEHDGTYDPWEIYNNNQAIRKVVTQLINGYYSADNPDLFRMIYDSLLHSNGEPADQYFILKDFDAYAKIQGQVDLAFRNRSNWAKTVMLNTASAGKFSSDRTIEEYVDEIWKLEKVKVDM